MTRRPALDHWLFDFRGVAFAAWTLAAFSIGALAGILIRRVVPAIVATLAGYTVLALVVGDVLRADYQPANHFWSVQGIGAAGCRVVSFCSSRDRLARPPSLYAA